MLVREKVVLDWLYLWSRARRCALERGVGGTSRCVSREDFNRDPDFDSRRDRRRRLSRRVPSRVARTSDMAQGWGFSRGDGAERRH